MMSTNKTKKETVKELAFWTVVSAVLYLVCYAFFYGVFTGFMWLSEKVKIKRRAKKEEKHGGECCCDDEYEECE